MTAHPVGTVTFLFTDIEGSTQLLQRVGETYRELLERERRLVRAACDAHGGVEIGTEGDSHFVVFPSAPEAVGATVDAQRALADEPWPEDAAVRVRMGLHTGEGATMEGGYVGIDVHRAARIASAGHGGQVLLSEATRALVEHSLPAGVSLRDLGEHRLKDLEHPERLAQLVVDGLPDEFPAIRSLDTRPHNLPVELSTFIGRDREIEEVVRLVGSTRLITLTGPGGTGKTRLGLRVGSQVLLDFADGVFFVPLAPISDPALVIPTVAQALGVQEAGGRSLLELVQRHLADRELLLILDNFEQVLPAAPLVVDLLSAAPRLKVLVTSRAVLHLAGEQEYPVEPLALPDPKHLPELEALSQFDSVALFIARARSVNFGFEVTNENAPAVAEICARLDGLPLAIELAAARSKLFSPEALLRRLESRLTLLRGGGADAPTRQQTLRDAIGWSYDLLGPGERALHRRLGVFVGGFSLESAEQVVGGMGEPQMDPLEGVAALTDQSLLKQVHTQDGEPRFFMLETIREFALEELASSGELEEAARRHAAFFLALAEEAEPQLVGERQAEWLDRVAREHDNLRAALRSSIDSGDAETAQRTAGAIWRFWHFRGHLSEGTSWLAEALAMPGGPDTGSARVKALSGLAGLAYWRRDYATAAGAYEEALAIARAGGDPREIAGALYNLAFTLGAMRTFDPSAELLEESRSLYLEAGDRTGVAYTGLLTGTIQQARGEFSAARAALEACLGEFRDVGDRWGIANAFFNLGHVSRADGDLSAALESYREALAVLRSAGDTAGCAVVVGAMAVVAASAGDGERAAILTGAWKGLEDEVAGGAPEALRGFDDPTARVRAMVGDARFEELEAEGRSLGLDKAVRYALED